MSSNGKPPTPKEVRGMQKYSREGMDYVQGRGVLGLDRQLKLPGGSDKSPAKQAIEKVDRERDPGRLIGAIRRRVESKNSNNRRPKKTYPMPTLQRWPGKGDVKT